MAQTVSTSGKTTALDFKQARVPRSRNKLECHEIMYRICLGVITSY